MRILFPLLAALAAPFAAALSEADLLGRTTKKRGR